LGLARHSRRLSFCAYGITRYPGQTLGRDGHSKDHRPDLKQRIVGVVIDSTGCPISSCAEGATQIKEKGYTLVEVTYESSPI
jgi:hypothetical protein